MNAAVPIVLIGLGLVLLLNLWGAAESLARFGQRQEARRGAWMTAGTPKKPGWVRLLGLAFIVLTISILIWPPS